MHPISKILCQTYVELHKEGQVSFPLHEEQKRAIDSVVKTVNAHYFGVERFPTPEDKAVAYLCYIIKDHPVTDGNKRLALLWFDVYCMVQHLTPNDSPFGLDALAVSIEKEERGMEEIFSDVKEILFGK